MMPQIDPAALRAARERQKPKKISQGELSVKMGVDKRTIATWESRKPDALMPNISEKNLQKLARTLNVPVGQLTGEDPVTDPLPVTHVTMRSKITTVAQMNYDLVSNKYDVSSDQLAQLAPLMFAILVEDSFAWRKEQLELHKKARELKSLLRETVHYYEGGPSDEDVDKVILNEEEAIDAREVFTRFSNYPDDSCWDDTFHSDRFTDFIASKVRKAGSNIRVGLPMGIEEYRNIMAAEVKYIAVSDLYQDITGVDDDAEKAALAFGLLSGLARLHDAPTDVQTTGALRAWVEERLAASRDDPTITQLWANIIQRQVSLQINNPQFGLDEDGFPTLFKPHPLSTSQATAEGEVK
jgi:transcriptional regulator with XRE-family HTH domain